MSSEEAKTQVTILNPDNPKVNPTVMIIKSIFRVSVAKSIADLTMIGPSGASATCWRHSLRR